MLRLLPTLMCVLVGATAFLLSYVALRDVAAETQAVPEHLAWAVPVCIDGGILAGSAVIWSSSYQRKRRDPLAFLTVAVLLATSVIINIHHAGDSTLAKWIAALPPVTLLACLELVASGHRRDQYETVHEAAPATAEVTDPAATTPKPTPAPAAAAETVLGSAPGVVPAAAPAAAVEQLAARDTHTPGLEVAPPAPTTTHPVPETERAPSTQPAASTAAFTEAAPARELSAATPVPAAVSSPDVPKRAEDLTAAARAAAPAPAERREKPVSRPAEAAAASSGSASERVQALFEQHLQAGGDPKDPSLAARLAAEAGVTPTYARRILRPLREKESGTVKPRPRVSVAAPANP